jgi:hypothetical protein
MQQLSLDQFGIFCLTQYLTILVSRWSSGQGRRLMAVKDVVGLRLVYLR